MSSLDHSDTGLRSGASHKQSVQARQVKAWHESRIEYHVPPVKDKQATVSGN